MMDLSFEAIHDVIHPTAAFSQGSGDGDGGRSSTSSYAGSKDCGDDDEHHNSIDDDAGWTQSQLNPKNRIDSLAPMSQPLWRIDGSAGFGTQFYAYPLFLDGPPPMHIDVFVHEGASYPAVVRELLDLDVSFHTKDAGRVRRLGIAQHILRILHWHTTKEDGSLRQGVVKNLYNNGPFGSRIVIDNLSCHIHESRIAISPNYPLENDLISYQELIRMWGLVDDESLPPEVSIDRVHLVRQLHDSISEVYVDNDVGDQPGEPERTIVVLKSLTSGVKYMYQEIRALLKDIPRHEYILSKPLHIVTKQCLFGRKRGVIGFTMPFLKAGSLRDALPLLRVHGRLHRADQLRWARQITEAMCHVWHEGHSFYPDLRLDNVVLTAPAPEGDAGLVDFEQRGVWSSFSAPEVDYVENVRLVAFDDQDFDFAIPEDVCREFKKKLVLCYDAAMTEKTDASTTPAVQSGNSKLKTPSKRPLILRLEEEVKYSNPALSYNVSWSCLTKTEQEAAMVYMLGRLMWCIFEGMSAPHHGAIWQSYSREPELEFPTFQHSCPEQKALVLRCFGDAGAKEQSRFVRWKSKLYMKQGVKANSSTSPSPMYELVSDDLVGKARLYWKEQLDEGEAWLQHRNEQLHMAAVSHDASCGEGSTKMVDGIDPSTASKTNEVSAHGRPTLNQVLKWVKELESQV
ncbi:hypothetical protein F503_01054 [Ophiostoma piceae UAMH 11346]|uniref:Protein kinase domain-containing protein n=1 Tax=Ophiostoma piceae (strain UAMH 11346) TaxID=1262450 RepID=S3C8L4_OPHP1|nr:hypothetical protein F503_01054 [Ophiostoma piceae UAMH 11346]